MGTLAQLAKTAGVAGIALGVFVLVFRDVIRKNIFPRLPARQAYKVIMAVLLMTFGIAAVGIFAWAWVKIYGPTPPVILPSFADEPATPEILWSRLTPREQLEVLSLAGSGCYFFDRDKAVVMTGDRRVDDAQQEFLSGIQDSQSLVIVGFTEGGSDIYAWRRSLRNAEAVKDRLVARGRSASDIFVEGRGKREVSERVRDFYCGARLIAGRDKNEKRISP